ncbi:hypothetical protein ASE39_25130 [Acidovorax sp. Root267]|nr:hypothetical protein ASE39_25130 [Acidovorax sp. Root267]
MLSHSISIVFDQELFAFPGTQSTGHSIGIIGILNKFKQRNFGLLYKPLAQLTHQSCFDNERSCSTIQQPMRMER